MDEEELAMGLSELWDEGLHKTLVLGDIDVRLSWFYCRMRDDYFEMATSRLYFIRKALGEFAGG